MDQQGKATSIDEYISTFPVEVQAKLNELRNTIHAVAPQATEKISWQMPTFYLYGNLVHFAAFSKHIGFYPGANGIERFLPKMEQYKTSKGAVQFPLNQPLPLDLVREIVAFRLQENLQWEEERKSKTKKK